MKNGNIKHVFTAFDQVLGTCPPRALHPAGCASLGGPCGFRGAGAWKGACEAHTGRSPQRGQPAVAGTVKIAISCGTVVLPQVGSASFSPRATRPRLRSGPKENPCALISDLGGACRMPVCQKASPQDRAWHGNAEQKKGQEGRARCFSLMLVGCAL